MGFASEHFKKLEVLTLGSENSYLAGKDIFSWIESALPTWLPALKALTIFSDFNEICLVTREYAGKSITYESLKSICPIAEVGRTPWAARLRSLCLGSFFETESFMPESDQAPSVFPLLEELRLSGMGLRFLSKWSIEAPRLESLHLLECMKIKSSDICGLLHKIPTLVKLDLGGEFVRSSSLDKNFVKPPEDRVLHLSLALEDGSDLASALCGNQFDKHLESLTLEQRGIDEALTEISKRVFPSLTALRFTGKFPEIERRKGLEE